MSSNNSYKTIRWCVLLVFTVTLVVYLSLPTRIYYGDGIGFADDIESARSDPSLLFEANHLLYDSVGYSIWTVAEVIHPHVRALNVLQVDGQLLWRRQRSTALLHPVRFVRILLHRGLAELRVRVLGDLVEVLNGCRQLYREHVLSDCVASASSAFAEEQTHNIGPGANRSDADPPAGRAVLSRLPDWTLVSDPKLSP